MTDSEREHAIKLANHYLDKHDIDPDNDICILARQFLRTVKRETMQAHLMIECAAINPPKPLGIAVQSEGRIIATISLENFKETASRLQSLESARAS